MTGRPAVFLDRDGTIIRDAGFVRRPDQVALLPGSAHAIHRLNQAGWPVVVVTNQSGIARGLLTGADYRAVHARLADQLEAEGAHLDGTYMCPHYPPVTGPCECRKPALRHYRQAAADLGIDLGRSVWIGDRLSDLQASGAFGGRAILVRTGEGAAAEPAAVAEGFAVVDDLAAAVGLILGAAAV